MARGPGNGGAEWIRGAGRDADVVMSSRVRLARNVAGVPFPNAAKREDRRLVVDMVRSAATQDHLAESLLWIEMNECPSLERSVLVERHLISKEHAKGAEPRAAAISGPDEWLSIMVNEEDHLRIQVMRSGLCLSEAFAQIDAVDDGLERRLTYSFSPRFGYLTACPTNVGTGMRVSVMLHLPALKITGEIDKVRRAAKGMNLAVRGFYGEGSDAVGDFYQLSNQTTLGKSERDLLDDFERRIVPEVIDYERHAREALMKKRRVVLEDKVQRAIGVLRHARMLGADEALQLLSHVRLGVSLGALDGVDMTGVNQLILDTQPAHLQRVAGREMDQSERRVARATLVRQRLAE